MILIDLSKFMCRRSIRKLVKLKGYGLMIRNSWYYFKITETLSNVSDVYFSLNPISPHSVDESRSFFFQNFQQILSDHVPTKTLL